MRYKLDFSKLFFDLSIDLKGSEDKNESLRIKLDDNKEEIGVRVSFSLDQQYFRLRNQNL